MENTLTLYGSTLCEQCQQAKSYLEQRAIPFAFVNIDILLGQERNAAMHVLSKAAMFPTVPTFKLGEHFLVGFDPATIEGFLARGDCGGNAKTA